MKASVEHVYFFGKETRVIYFRMFKNGASSPEPSVFIRGHGFERFLSIADVVDGLHKEHKDFMVKPSPKSLEAL